MKRTWTVAVAGLGVAAAAGAVLASRRGPEVEVATAARGSISETVEGTGKARVRERHVVASPVPGALERVEVHAGDAVREGQPVAWVRPLAPAPLDARTRAEAQARAAAARAAEAEAAAAVRRAEVAETDASRALARARLLLTGDALAARDLETSEAAAGMAAQEVRAARAALARARGERIAVEALLASPSGRGPAQPLAAPAAGVVLRVVQESPGPVQAGTPVVEVGDPRDVEVALELLTEQASRVRPGAAVELVAWPGDEPLRGVVRRVEPSAFTKVSALGVEEQRVLVLVDPAGDRARWAPVADGWRIEGRVVVAERADAVKLPASSVVRGDRGWGTFVVEGGRARLRPIRLGASTADEVEVVSGVSPGERVVLRPTSAIEDGARVRTR
ncbi:efflux RND transporter periplasmic adaptor subunit [Anaeromyxobacter oryzae]|uniref:Membrane protein n=1 Tax=Anaeromyxobacter oryzae TaxID=2918170 RepID=A0ABM7WPQ6_9BACT|nr:HlyD family efflux transporter periplasmic adaptor subunit [Anaeromyxobacter oryzae]BDG01436.1 membrane protein [Anaeromyxobacter oryzae]